MLEKNRMMAVWASADTRARVWFTVACVTGLALFASLWTTIHLLNRPREVVRVGCDGVPQLVTITGAYDEPNDAEIRAFVTAFAIQYGRMDSFSVMNDVVFCAQNLVPELRETFRVTGRQLIATLEPLRRRTHVDPARVEIELDKTRYPVTARVKGVRQVLGNRPEEQPFQFTLELVRASRREVLTGLLVYRIHADGEGLPNVVSPR